MQISNNFLRYRIVDLLFLMSRASIVPYHLFEQTGLAKLSRF